MAGAKTGNYKIQFFVKSFLRSTIQVLVSDPMSKGLAVLFCLICSTAGAQGPQNVLLVVNRRSVNSPAVADYYAQRRRVPASNVCSIDAPVDEEIGRAAFDKFVRSPILNCLQNGKLQDRVLYIVLTKGVPLKIKSGGGKDDQASVDSELTLLYQDMLGAPHPLPGRIPNLYFAGDTGTSL